MQAAEILRRFQECREKALVTNHLMTAEVVESRLFWLEDPGRADPGSFDETKWEVVARKLAIFERHAWAARVRVDGHLRAARRFGGRGERARARKELDDAARLIDANPRARKAPREQFYIKMFFYDPVILGGSRGHGSRLNTFVLTYAKCGHFYL